MAKKFIFARRAPAALTVALLAAVALWVGQAACGTSSLPRAGVADSLRAAERFPGTTLDDLHRGRSLYLARCTGCHQPILPSSQPHDRWPAQVEEMKERAHLNPHEASLVVRYLVTMATLSGGQAPLARAGLAASPP